MRQKKRNPSELIAAHIPVERVSWNRIRPAAETLQRAFADNSLMRYLATAARDPNAAVQQNFSLILARARVNGVVMRTSESHEGIAVWYLNGFGRSNFFLDLAIIWYKLRAFRWREISCLLPFYIQVEKAHARIIRQPHYYLEILGVAPQYRGQGFASKLLRPVLEHADANRRKCYLETQSQENVALYEHFGFEVVETIPADFDDTPYSLMLRKPVPQSSYFFNN